MSLFTNFLSLFKYDPINDKEKTFNITQALNNNWDKIDEEFKRQDEEIKSHKADNMPHQIQDLENNKIYRYGLQMKDGKPQIIYEEVV